jgi:uncharacterized HAD superfamily protein
MKIAIDFDSTLVSCPVIKLTVKDFGLSWMYFKNHRYDLTDMPKKLCDEIKKRMTNSYYMIKKIKLFDGVKDKLKEWKNKGHKLILITARNKSIEEETKKYIRTKLPMLFDKVIFVNNPEDKKKSLIRENIEVVIDDSPIVAKMSADLKLKTYLISNENTHYNYYIKTYKNVIPVEKIVDITL